MKPVQKISHALPLKTCIIGYYKKVQKKMVKDLEKV
jgi:hypothetical protein